jgi:hypothetical protein
LRLFGKMQPGEPEGRKLSTASIEAKTMLTVVPFCTDIR